MLRDCLGSRQSFILQPLFITSGIEIQGMFVNFNTQNFFNGIFDVLNTWV